MRAVVVAGLGAVLVAEGAAAAVGHRDRMLIVAGVVVALVLAALHAGFSGRERTAADADEGSERAEVLGQWSARTRSLLEWSDGTRGDWDRHLRPLLARELAQSAGLRTLDEPATGLLLFGPELWPWVDPSNVAAAGSAARDEPGPGRAALSRILDRLERL
ncbi:hypothetical protein G4X40_07460 [Rhodococcus sp. D2-41]|uniref:hypothetical protein n=1 Tax=Speluncibacter jeojiensis TaxID=2710754 RepID=UPI00240F95DB|nr:hypothetical protein [Rhodococcus sp. D2-41]MDG3009983.1 hypothetical protein [Rhodococcus sp. D2-41]